MKLYIEVIKLHGICSTNLSVHSLSGSI